MSNSTSRKVPVTLLAVVYNEQARIRALLEQGTRWADEVLIADKGSDDGTLEICQEYGSSVRVVPLPFSPKGHENMVEIFSYPKHDWVFLVTASEIPTFNLVQEALQILEETRGDLDLIYVPRRMYSFGIHSARSPWSVCHYPFMVNRARARICNTIHVNFSPSNPKNTRMIPYREDCCVYHFTHPNAKQYLTDMMQYFEAEVTGSSDPTAKLKECLSHVASYQKRLRKDGDPLFGHYCAWLIYWLGTALYLWESQRDFDVPEYYSQLRKEVLEREWLAAEPQKGFLRRDPSTSGLSGRGISQDQAAVGIGPRSAALELFVSAASKGISLFKRLLR
ncbi:hypothetical protein GMST_02710 [Geomonas silvestris]|uniref:Glycosyltransferase 2-like domain-containing protein n=2 Tax=Geomonas silvestris TaxID=2740184 RepID=A0A6V8MDB0_9BACT|nr:hypothetical protein GMST_02710 [Geomonas silvestris]